MEALAGDRIYPPFLTEQIGRIFYNETSYFVCDIENNNVNANTLNSYFGPMNTIESWFRLDPFDKRPDGYISTVFAAIDASTGGYIHGIRLSNTFLRIHLNDVIHDIAFNFTETDDYWHYVAVSTVKLHEHVMRMTVFIDGEFAFEEEYLDILSWSEHVAYTNGDLTLEIGKDFPGVIRKVKINA
jgi:hypothetical protein